MSKRNELTIKPDVSINYDTPHDALLDEGYDFDDLINAYRKDGVSYKYAGMENCNTTIYTIWLKRIKKS